MSHQESGLYKCVSQRLKDNGFTVGEVQMVVKNAFSAMDGVKLAAICISIVVIITCIVLYLRLRKEWNKYDGRGVVPGICFGIISTYIFKLQLCRYIEIKYFTI